MGQSILAMITTVVRFKLFTLDHRLILNKVGSLAERDRKAVVVSIREILADIY